MNWSERIYCYCERGSDPAFWAEPLNAVTNAAFILAAIFAAVALMRRPAGHRGIVEALLVAIIFVMGVGSFLFHTYATAWAAYADTGPIAVFMVSYLAYALRRFVGLHWVWVAVGLGMFVAALKAAGGVQCQIALIAPAAATQSCLNGTAGYAPAFVAMALIAIVLALVRHPAWRYLAAASAIFLVSMAFRTVDHEICEHTAILGHRTGTHFVWHVLNATMLYILAIAAIRHGDHAHSPSAGEIAKTGS